MRTPHLVFEPKDIAAAMYDAPSETLELVREGSFRTVTASRIRVKMPKQEASKIMEAIELEKLPAPERTKREAEIAKRKADAAARFAKVRKNGKIDSVPEPV
jgi:hypothetical protein